jgi:hypothetical protein
MANFEDERRNPDASPDFHYHEADQSGIRVSALRLGLPPRTAWQGIDHRWLEQRVDFARALWHARKVETTGESDSADSLAFGTDEDVMAALDRLSRHAFENGLYDRNEMPEGGSDE